MTVSDGVESVAQRGEGRSRLGPSLNPPLNVYLNAALMVQTIHRTYRQGRCLVRERSQSPDLPSRALSPNLSVLLPPNTVLNVVWRLTILTLTLLPH